MASLDVKFIEWNESQTPGTYDGTEVTTLNFGSTDTADLTPSSAKITAGDNSYSKHIKFQFSGSFTSITNAKVYKSAGTYESNVDILYSGSSQKTGAPSQTTITTNDGSIPTSLPSYNNLVLRVGSTTDAGLPNPSDVHSSPGYYSGSRSDITVWQLTTTESSPAGAGAQLTHTIQYDVS